MTTLARDGRFGAPAVVIIRLEFLGTRVVVSPKLAEQRAVDEALRSTLAAGRRPSLRSTARLLAVSPRTLQRRLDKCGVTFSTMLARAETHRACDLLKDSLRPIREVSAALGYRDPSSFSRAFRQWTGVSPREYRNALGS